MIESMMSSSHTMTDLRVLMIEDCENDARVILQQLRQHGYTPYAERVDGCEDLVEALKQQWDLILADYSLPGFSALEALAIVQEVTPTTPFVLVSGVVDDLIGMDFMHAGACDYINKGNIARLPMVIQREVTRTQGQRQELEKQTSVPAPELSRFTLNQLVNAWSLTSEKAFPTFIGHQRRVAQFAVAIGEKLQYTHDQVQALSTAALLHDIGKSWLPRTVWEKDGPLSPREWELAKKHAEIGYTILKTIPFPWAIADAVLQHHERLDGSGYPHQLTGDQILLDAKILAVADAIEALTSPRCHRPKYELTVALRTLDVEAGVRYDATLVEICHALVDAGEFPIK